MRNPKTGQRLKADLDSLKEDVGYESIMGIIDRFISTEINWESIRR